MNPLRPMLAGLAVVFIWSGWITVSRYGVHSQLQPADITLLRYWTAMLAISPLLFRFPWRKYRLPQYLVVGLGVGFPYTLFSFYGLKVLKAAHAGVLVNGMLPVLGAIAAWALFREQIPPLRYAAVFLIFLANCVMAGGDVFTGTHSLGILLLLGAAVVYTLHMIGIRFWQVPWQDAIVIVPVANVVLFTPLWFFLPTSLIGAPFQDIAVQAVYQGIIVNVIALMCVAYAIRHLGTITVSLFMSFVPVTTALLAWILLDEVLTVRELAGIAGCSAGLLLYARSGAPPASTATPPNLRA